MSTELVIAVDTSIHELEALKRVCYSFGDKCSIRLERLDETHVVAHCQALNGTDLPPGFSDDFHKALLDFGIRVTLARETAEIRDLIFRQAFVEADL